MQKRRLMLAMDRYHEGHYKVLNKRFSSIGLPRTGPSCYVKLSVRWRLCFWCLVLGIFLIRQIKQRLITCGYNIKFEQV